MAEHGDPDAPKPTDPAVEHDDLVGFSSAAALQGRPRVVPAPESAPEPTPLPDAADASAMEPEPELFASPEPTPRQPVPTAPEAQPASPVETSSWREPEPTVAPPQPAPLPSWAVETPTAAGSIRMDGRTVVPPKEVTGSNGLYAVYALILFAVPTLGVSVLIALLAVTGRPGPSEQIAASHFMYQQRTLWTAAVAALLGAILIAVGLGVFVLFIVAVWMILRGASGVLTLKAGRPVRDPRGWFLA